MMEQPLRIALTFDDGPNTTITPQVLDILEAEGVPCRVIYLPDGLDPDEFIRQRGLAAFEAIQPMRPPAYRMQRLRLQ